MNEENGLEKLKEFRGMIKSIAIRYSRNDEDIFEDLMIVGEVACLKSIGSFDETKNAKLSTYLYSKIEGAVKDEIKTKYRFFGRKTNGHPIPLDDVESELSYEIEDIIANRSDNEKLKKVLEKLTGKEKKLLWLRYWEDMTFVEIAKEMKIQEARASQMHTKILKKLKGMIESEDVM